MKQETIDRVINAWKNHLFQGELQDYQLEIDENVPLAFAAIALHLDSRTIKASGKEEEYYEGFREAAIEVLSLIQVEIAQDDQLKVISLYHKETDDGKQEELAQHIGVDKLPRINLINYKISLSTSPNTKDNETSRLI